MNDILCSTGALIGRPNNRDYTLLKPLSEQLQCDGFEFMMYSSWYDEAERLVDFLQQIHLHVPVMHCEKHIGQACASEEKKDLEEAVSLFRTNCEIAKKLGANRIVLHLWDGMVSDSHFVNNLRAYRRLQETAEEYGIDILVENVVCNCGDPMSHWCELQETYPDIHFVFDTKMAAFHRQEELLYRPEYDWLWQDGHIRHFHVNDYGGGYMEWGKLKTLPIGDGHVDFDQFFTFIRKIHYQGSFTVEATAFGPDGAVDVEMLNRSFARIRGYLEAET